MKALEPKLFPVLTVVRFLQAIVSRECQTRLIVGYCWSTNATIHHNLAGTALLGTV